MMAKQESQVDVLWKTLAEKQLGECFEFKNLSMRREEVWKNLVSRLSDNLTEALAKTALVPSGNPKLMVSQDAPFSGSAVAVKILTAASREPMDLMCFLIHTALEAKRTEKIEKDAYTRLLRAISESDTMEELKQRLRGDLE